MFAELLETSVVVVSYVCVGLTELFGDFCERVSFKKVQSQRFLLFLGQCFYDPAPAIFPENAFNGLVIVCARISRRFNFAQIVRNSGRIQTVRLQFAPPLERLSVRNLEDPRTGRAFAAIEKRSLAMEIKKHFLNQILGFRIISEDAAPYVS